MKGLLCCLFWVYSSQFTHTVHTIHSSITTYVSSLLRFACMHVWFTYKEIRVQENYARALAGNACVVCMYGLHVCMCGLHVWFACMHVWFTYKEIRVQENYLALYMTYHKLCYTYLAFPSTQWCTLVMPSHLRSPPISPSEGTGSSSS